MNDDEGQGAPVELVRSDLRLTFRMTAEQFDMRNETVRKISVKDLGIRKLTATLVSRNLTEEQKDRRPHFVHGFRGRTSRRQFFFLDHVITGDKTWCYQYVPAAKRQSMEWRLRNSPRPNEPRMSTSKIKIMLICFFDIIHFEFVPDGATVNQIFYAEVLKKAY
jgi:hypothetical protein